MVQPKICNHGDANMAGCPACDFYDSSSMFEEYREIASQKQAKILAIEQEIESQETKRAKNILLSRLEEVTELKNDADAAIRELEARLANIRPLLSDAENQQEQNPAIWDEYVAEHRQRADDTKRKVWGPNARRIQFVPESGLKSTAPPTVNRVAIPSTQDGALEHPTGWQLGINAGIDPSKPVGVAGGEEPLYMPMASTYQPEVLGLPGSQKSKVVDEKLLIARDGGEPFTCDEASLRKISTPEYGSNAKLSETERNEMFAPGTFLANHVEMLAGYYSANSHGRPEDFEDDFEKKLKLAYEEAGLPVKETPPKRPSGTPGSREPLIGSRDMIGFTNWLHEWRANCENEGAFRLEIEQWSQTRKARLDSLTAKAKETREAGYRSRLPFSFQKPSDFHENLQGPNELAEELNAKSKR